MHAEPIFRPTAYSGAVWDLAERQLARPRPVDVSHDELREEMAIRDLYSRFGYALDRGDVDGLVSLYAEDGTLSSPRGTTVGLEAIRAEVEEHFQAVRRRFHVWSNVMVRLDDGLERAWVTANFFGITQADGKQADLAGGLLADEVVKQGGVWKIRAHSITADLGGHM